MVQEITNAMADLEEDVLLSKVQEAIGNDMPRLEIISSLQQGLNVVGERFESKEYFLSELIMSADLFNEATDLIGLDDIDESEDFVGTFLIGTVQSDIHYIGKNIVVSIMKSNGFKVIDIGEDVPVQEFVDAVKKYNPQIIGMSCLLTTAFESMKNTIDGINKAGIREGKCILIGGGPVDNKTKEYVGADYLCSNAQEAVNICKRFLGVAE